MTMDMNMDGFVVPNMQAWFRQNSFICTPDNGLLYHSRTDVNYIAALVKDQMPNVRIFNVRATIRSLACSPDWSERREFATLDDQNSLLVWDLDQEAAVKGHKGHVYKLSTRTESRGGGQNNDVSSAICFTQTQKVISVDRSVMIIYCMVADTYKIYADFFKPSQTVVTLSACPHERHVFAAGLRNGLIVIFSIRDMNVLFNMRGHDSEIVSIDWMQVRVRSEQSRISWRREERPLKQARKKRDDVQKSAKKPAQASAVAAAADASDIFDIYDYNENEEEFGTIIDRETSSYDQKDRYRDKIHTTEGFNFLEECQHLKDDMMKAKQEQEQQGDESVLPDDVERPQDINTDDENELDEAEKFRDFIIVDGDGTEKPKSGSEEEQGDEELQDEQEESLRTILVTSSRERVLYFWDYESGVPVDKVALPSNQSNKRLCPSIFITAAWVNPSKIVANTCAGHVFEWDVSFFFLGTRLRMTAKQNLTRYPVDMAIYLVRARGAIGDLNPKADYVWCQSINRKIVGVSVSQTPEIVADLTCLSTGNTCIVENPLESTVLAVGCTDRKLVTLNLASLAYNDVNCVPYMNKICSKVTTLDWHPERENYIAFGTSEGRIGLLDTNSPNNVPILLNSFLSTDVYTLKWAELTDEFHQTSIVLFATGKSKMAYYKMIGAGKHDPVELRQFGMVSSVSASGHFLFVGTQDGFVFINDLTKSMSQLYHRNIARRYICSMQFKDNVLAVASNENNIRLIDFTNGMDDKLEDNITLLEGHTEGVCCLRWGYGDSKLLVSGSFDNTVRVWDTSTTSCIAAYHNVDSVFCAIFSPVQENIVILTGKGTTLSFIDYTKHPVTTNSVLKKNKHQTKWATEEGRNDKKAARNKNRKTLGQLENSVDSLRITEKPSTPPTNDVTEESKSQNGEQSKPSKPTPEVDELAEQLKEIKFKEIKPVQLKTNIPTTFHLTNREINKPADVLACIVKLTHFKEPEEDEEAESENGEQAVAAGEPKTDEKRYFNEKLFTTEKDLRELIDEETKNHHTANTASIGTILLPQIGFRLKDAIIERIASKTLTDQLVALAPSISFEFWRKCCEAYANQFLEKQYPLAAIPYFLASHKLDQAIDSLCKHKYFREAWAICKLRKAEEDPIRGQVSSDWAQYLESVGNLEGAALVWTASKKYKNAVAVLSKRKELSEDIQLAIEALNAKLQE